MPVYISAYVSLIWRFFNWLSVNYYETWAQKIANKYMNVYNRISLLLSHA